MAAAGPARAARYDWPIIARQYVELMTRIVTASGKPPGR
jgi:hypothetical protein